MEKIGKARIYFGEDKEGLLVDDVEIHSNGVVRASNRGIRDVEDIGTTLGETKVTYYSPHAWTKIEPKTHRDCTLWVSDILANNDPTWVPLKHAWRSMTSKTLQHSIFDNVSKSKTNRTLCTRHSETASPTTQ